MNETYLYPYSAKEARERNELSLWRESHRANIACRDAIEDTIRRSFDGMHLNEDCLAPVLTAYGYKRTAWVLANRCSAKIYGMGERARRLQLGNAKGRRLPNRSGGDRPH